MRVGEVLINKTCYVRCLKCIINGKVKVEEN